MGKLAIIIILVAVLLLAYGTHKLIRRFINPRTSANHLFLFFLAHFVAIFILVFFINLLIIKFSGFLFPA